VIRASASPTLETFFYIGPFSALPDLDGNETWIFPQIYPGYFGRFTLWHFSICALNLSELPQSARLASWLITYNHVKKSESSVSSICASHLLLTFTGNICQVLEKIDQAHWVLSLTPQVFFSNLNLCVYRYDVTTGDVLQESTSCTNSQ
jgi:hypothetical protein